MLKRIVHAMDHPHLRGLYLVRLECSHERSLIVLPTTGLARCAICSGKGKE